MVSCTLWFFTMWRIHTVYVLYEPESSQYSPNQQSHYAQTPKIVQSFSVRNVEHWQKTFQQYFQFKACIILHYVYNYYVICLLHNACLLCNENQNPNKIHLSAQEWSPTTKFLRSSTESGSILVVVGEEEWNCLAPLSSGHTVLYAIGRVSKWG